MKKYGLYLKASFLAFAFLLIACNKINNETPGDISVKDAKVFYGNVSSDEASVKTFIDSKWNVYWYAGDLISVFRSAVNEKYRFAGQTGEIANEFHKVDYTELSSAYSVNYAIYPYSASASCNSDGVLETTLPALQHYAEDGFGQDANTMVAATTSASDSVFFFKNACAYLLLKIYGGDPIRRIKFYGNNSEKIAGAATIKAQYGKSPELTMASDDRATCEIMLDCGEDGIKTGLEKDEYIQFWIVLPAMQFSKGFTVELENTYGGKLVQSTSRNTSFTVNKVKSMAPLLFSKQTGHKFETFSLSNGTDKYDAYSIQGGYIDIMVPNQTDLSNMTASFTYRGVEVKIGEEVQISGQGAHNFNDFTSPVEYTVYASNGTSSNYKVRIFDLPVLYIDTPGGKGITSKTVWIEEATIKMRGTDNVEIDLGKTSIKGRGNYSWRQFNKKPYALKLASKTSFFSLPKHKRWCLLANSADRTLVRNMVSFEIARHLNGLAWTPAGDFVELILNGQYVGNYWLCEHIKIDANRVNISEDYGQIMTIDNTYDEVWKFKSAKKNMPYMFKDPDEIDSTRFYATQAYVNEMETAIYDDARFAARDYLNYIDVPSYIDLWLVNELVGNDDFNHPRSVFVYRDGDGIFYSGPAWDFDTYTFVPTRSSSWINKNAMYYGRFFNDQEFKNEVYRRWMQYKPHLDTIPVYFDRIVGEVRRSESRDRTIWPYYHPGNLNKENDLSFDQAVSRARQAYIDKLRWMDIEIKKMPVLDSRGGVSEDYSDQEDKSGDLNIGF